MKTVSRGRLIYRSLRHYWRIYTGVSCGVILASAILTGALLVGELSLDGGARHVSGVLPMAAMARQEEIETFFLPAADANEAALIPDLKVIPVKNLTKESFFQQVEIGGASPTQMNQIIMRRDRVDRTLGMSEAKRGSAQGGVTATAEQIAAFRELREIGALAEKEKATEIAKRLAALIEKQTQQMPGIRGRGGADGAGQRRGTRQGGQTQ